MVVLVYYNKIFSRKKTLSILIAVYDVKSNKIKHIVFFCVQEIWPNIFVTGYIVVLKSYFHVNYLLCISCSWRTISGFCRPFRIWSTQIKRLPDVLPDEIMFASKYHNYQVLVASHVYLFTSLAESFVHFHKDFAHCAVCKFSYYLAYKGQQVYVISQLEL